jgi:general secretion pathway protein D
VARRLPALAVALALAVSAGCASGGALRAGQQAEQLRDYDLAVAEYTRALRQRPDDRDARISLDRARLRAADAHFIRGRRLAALDRFEEALIEFQIANELNPASADVEAELRRTRASLRARLAMAPDGQTALQSLIARSRTQPPPGLDLPDVTMPAAIVTGPRTTSRELYQMLAKFGDINIMFDPSFESTPAQVDFRGNSLRDALDAVSTSTRNFWRVTAPRTITIVPDTPLKRREYQEDVVRTFFLSNADLKETTDLLRVVVDARQVYATTATNSITIRDTPERIEAVGRLLNAIDKARPEVVIDVELLEVDRERFKEYGLQIASGAEPGVSGGLAINEEGLTLRGLRSLSQSDVIVFGLPALYYRLLKTDTNTRTLASPHIRMSDGIATQARFGERVPVPVTTFVPLAQGGVNQQAITSVVYEPIGVNIDILPRLHHDDQVTLNLKVEVSNVAGAGFQGLPTFGSRVVSTTIRLRDGETNILAGLIRDDERTVLHGVPGLSDLPIIGRLFGRNQRQTKETDIVITMTPHIVRVLDLSEEDVRAFRMARDAASIGSLPQIDIPTGSPIIPRDPLPPPGGDQIAQPIVQPGVPLGSLPTTPAPIRPPPKKPGGGGH